MSMKRKIIIGIVSIVLIGIIYCFFNLGNFLVVSDDLKKADAIVIFSGDNGFRTEVGVDLLKKGYGDYLIVSGGKVYDDVTMAELMKNHAIKLGVDENSIILENKSETTSDNAKFTKKIIEENNFESIILVTSDYHTRRAKATMEKALEDVIINGKKVEVIVRPSAEEKFTTRWWTSGNSVLIIISEYLKLAGYFAKGYI